MCNNTIVTSIGNTWERALLLYQLGLYGMSAKPGNFDGYGLSDGKTIIKGPELFVGMDKLKELATTLDEKSALTLHLRAASMNTGRTEQEVHPWVFETKYGPFVAQHNGFFKGSWTGYTASKGVVTPNSDSYRAFVVLAGMLEENKGEMNSDLIGRWLSKYEVDSAFAIVIHYQGRVIFFRNKERFLHAAKFGSGYIIQTHASVIERLRTWCSVFFPQIEIGQPFEVPADTYVELSVGTHEVVCVEELEYELCTFKPAVVHTAPQPPQKPKNKVVVVSEVGNEGPAEEVLSVIAKERIALWKKICQRLAPLRFPMILLHVAISLNKSIKHPVAGDTFDLNMNNYSVRDLRMFLEYFCKDKLNEAQTDFVLAWNKLVAAENEIDTHFQYVDPDGRGEYFLWFDDNTASSILAEIYTDLQ